MVRCGVHTRDQSTNEFRGGLTFQRNTRGLGELSVYPSGLILSPWALSSGFVRSTRRNGTSTLSTPFGSASEYTSLHPSNHQPQAAPRFEHATSVLSDYAFHAECPVISRLTAHVKLASANRRRSTLLCTVLNAL